MDSVPKYVANFYVPKYVANFYPIFNDHIECCVLLVLFCAHAVAILFLAIQLLMMWFSYTINDVDYLLEAPKLFNGIGLVGERVKLVYPIIDYFIPMCVCFIMILRHES